MAPCGRPTLWKRLGALFAPKGSSPAEGERAVRLRDGTLCVIREIRPEDADALARALAGLSAESRYQRFLQHVDRLTPEQLAYLTNVDGQNHLALGLGVLQGRGRRRTVEPIGIARSIRRQDSPETAEVAVVVADAWQGRGAGTALLAELARRALATGVRRWTAVMLERNRSAARALEGRGEIVDRRRLGDGVVELTCHLSPEQPASPPHQIRARLPAALALASLLLLPLPAPRAGERRERTNLLFLMTDDQGAWTLGAYGNRESRTPAMDRLAREGARFLNAFTPTPVCSPSRATLLTGRYGTQVGITDWISPEESRRGLGLPRSERTWIELLKDRGYATGLLGKWHLGDRPQFHPTRRGFDLFYGFLVGGNQPINPTLEVDGVMREEQGSEPDLLAERAIRFIRANERGPFALLVHFRAPHLPYGPVPPEDREPFRNLDPTVPQGPGLDVAQVKRLTREYYASIYSVDRSVGRMLAELDRLGLTRRTAVIFTSDHGYNLGHHGIHTKGNGFWMTGGVNGPKRPNMWDTSIRVPLLIRHPPSVRADLEIEPMVSFVDFYPSIPTLLGVGSAGRPAGSDGRDFTPLLLGERPSWRSMLFGQYDLHNGGLAYMRMVRSERWKLVRHLRSRQLDELYDLGADPGETRNQFTNQATRTIRAQLGNALADWMARIGDPLARHLRERLKEEALP